ncbi:MAG: hypothetical protein WC360_08220, partial [Opitutales bacterium]
GVTIDIPAGALPADTDLTISSVDAVIDTASGEVSGRVIGIESSGVTTFDQPLTITIPFDPTAGYIPIPYYIGPDGLLVPCQIVSIDEVNGTMTFQTFHASIFTDVLAYVIDTIFPVYGGRNILDYTPDINGFQILNTGSIYNPGGECFGISAFAQWYYRTGHGTLYTSYMDDIPLSGGATTKGQNIIATRAHTSVARYWNQYLPGIMPQYNLSDGQIYISIKNYIDNQATPAILYLNSPGAAHAVLAYGYDHGDISINDPNHPGVMQPMAFNVLSSSFDDYQGYPNILLIGTGSFSFEQFSNIYQDAVNDFDGSGLAQVNVTSHQDGEDVTERTIYLSGTISSGSVLVDKLVVWLNAASKFEANVDTSGNFVVPISLVAGENNLTFETKGKDASSNVIDVQNTQMVPFVLNYVSDNAVILVTLTWNTTNTDIDLYTYDPTGDVSWYGHMGTADGGILDFDNTTGYGPEHFTLTYTDTVHWDEEYRVRVHFYSNHTDEYQTPTQWTVSIVLYEGEARSQSFSFSGTLTLDSSDNHLPGNSGADWADVAVIVPTQAPPAPAGNSAIVWQPTASQVPIITVPIKPEALIEDHPKE